MDYRLFFDKMDKKKRKEWLVNAFLHNQITPLNLFTGQIPLERQLGKYFSANKEYFPANIFDEAIYDIVISTSYDYKYFSVLIGKTLGFISHIRISGGELESLLLDRAIKSSYKGIFYENEDLHIMLLRILIGHHSSPRLISILERDVFVEEYTTACFWGIWRYNQAKSFEYIRLFLEKAEKSLNENEKSYIYLFNNWISEIGFSPFMDFLSKETEYLSHDQFMTLLKIFVHTGRFYNSSAYIQGYVVVSPSSYLDLSESESKHLPVPAHSTSYDFIDIGNEEMSFFNYLSNLENTNIIKGDKIKCQ